MDITQRKMTKTAREVSKFTVRTLRADGIGTGEFDVIHVIRHNPGITQTEVCAILGIDKGSAARKIASLEAKGYLTRHVNPADGRSRLLYATEQAANLKNSKARDATSGCWRPCPPMSRQSLPGCWTSSTAGASRRARRASPT